MSGKTGNKTYDDVALSAESTRQGAVNVAGVSQSTATASTVTYYRACLASKIANSLDAGAEIFALRTLGATV